MKDKLCVGLSTLLFSALVSAPAAAQTEEPNAQAGTEPAASGARLHNGFYFNAGLGAGYLRDDFETTFSIFRKIEGRAQGASVAGQIMAGGTPAKGLVIGGGVFFEQVANPKIEVDGQSVADNVSVGVLVLTGAFVNWYPNPAQGFHLMGALGGARITIKDDSGNTKDNSPIGGGGIVGVGYDFWIADEWSLGVLGRITGATLSQDNLRHNVVAGSALFTVTYH